ncbi:MAG TPA: acetamidase/formamidase family protein [Nakamurella sp.]
MGPRRFGGNLDCRELVAGSPLYLPIGVHGALFSVGDGHAAQGEGELAGTAFEGPMDRVELTIDVVPDMNLDGRSPPPRRLDRDGSGQLAG